ncbi:MAG: hypothetical protein V1900_04095 [Candidatus Aenigmatarchaeota archaeon]
MKTKTMVVIFALMCILLGIGISYALVSYLSNIVTITVTVVP